MTTELNDLLGRELGRRADGHGIFAWKNSNELFWPAFRTGRTLTKRVELVVPIIGGGTQVVEQDTVVPEYRRDRQIPQPDTWVVTKWLSDVELIWGWTGRHGAALDPGVKAAQPAPARESLESLWQSRFPGADYPERGWRIPTNATLPRRPGGPRIPNLTDTRFFIAQVKEQTRLNFSERQADMEADMDARSDRVRREIEDEVRDAFPAFLNPSPGTRSSFVSFPGIRKFFR